MRALNKEILRLAIPSILANITIPLVGLVDLAIAGHLSAGEAATLIGGISIGSMLFDLLYWNFGFLRVGTGGMTAQAWGRGDRHEMASLLVRGVGLAFLIAGSCCCCNGPLSKAFSCVSTAVRKCGNWLSKISLSASGPLRRAWP